MSKTVAWIKAFRLRTLPLSLSGIIVGSSIALDQGHWNTTIFVLAMLTTLFFQILSNLANDLGDSLKGADNEHRVGPMRSVQSGLISVFEMKMAVVIFVLLSLSTAIPLIIVGVEGLPKSILYLYTGLAIAAIIAAITYTMGKKAYGYSGLGDVFVFIFFGGVSVLGVYTLYAKTFDYTATLMALTIGLLSVVVLNLNNMRDQINDANVGKRTLVVKIGFRAAKIYHSGLIIGAFVSLIIYSLATSTAFLISLLPFSLIFIHLTKVWRTTTPKELDPELKKVALSTFLIALLFLIAVFI
jgi:1,4-dihydroxy-2-naphthoate polyprenyltransferase